MTREKAKELLPIIQAFADGKTIQWRNKSEKHWKEPEDSRQDFAFDNFFEYRIKPEPREFWFVLVNGGIQAAAYKTEKEALELLSKIVGTTEIIHVKEVL